MNQVNHFTKVSAILFIFVGAVATQNQNWFKEKHSHSSKKLTIEELQWLALASPKISFESLLNPILVPRISGTKGNEDVRNYITSQLKNHGWSINFDEFQDKTPLGEKKFSNIIATLNPASPRRLVLACHYDSKYSSGNDLIGATDSAVPCAMLLHMAHTLQGPLATLQGTDDDLNGVGLQFIFFDGEEAFQRWGPTDSLYGSRHLATILKNTPYPPGNTDGTTELDRMDMMILLDLIGGAKPKFWNFYKSTVEWQNELVEIESILRKDTKEGFWSGSKGSWWDWGGAEYFRSQFSYSRIDDDHIPFQKRGVDILHVISSPFPRVWHTAKDNKEYLDFNTIDNLNRIFRIFVARYLHLEVNQDND